MEKYLSRKEFIKAGSAAAAGLGLTSDAGAAESPSAAKPEKFDAGGEYTVKISGRDYCWRARFDKGRLTALDQAPDTSTDLWLTRGLVDIQVNGYAGVELTSPELSLEGLAACEQALARQGLVRWCPTVTSQEPQLIREVLAKIAAGVEKGALNRVHCIHMEANFLSGEEGYRGAHVPRYLTDPDQGEFDSWQKAAGGRIGYVSLAPERNGGLELIRYLAAKGILVALAHHNAPYETVCAAADAGARLSTHLFNGCASIIPRHNNVIFSQLSQDRLWASFIPDGHHIPYHALKVGLRAKGLERSVFTSDLVALGGSPEGLYTVDGQEVEIRQGAAFLKGTPYLYGAWSSLAQGIERATAAAVVSPSEALRLTSLNPARLLALEDNLEPAPEKSGPFVFFREQTGALRLAGIIC